MLGAAGHGPDWTVVGIAIGVFLGAPGWLVSYYSLKSKRENEKNHQLIQAVRTVLSGDISDNEDGTIDLDTDHPSFRALLMDIRDNTNELSWMSAVMAFHLSDDHGPQVPTMLRNRDTRRKD